MAIKLWRPDDWETHFKKFRDPLFRKIFELGADAMLEALLQNDVSYVDFSNQETTTSEFEASMLCRRGKIIFIPDNE